MTEYELVPKYDSRKSFYGKAKVVEDSGTISLISYKSCICKIATVGLDDVEVTIFDIPNYNGGSLTFSNTSLRHLKEFLKQNGLRADSKKQILNDYIISERGV